MIITKFELFLEARLSDIVRLSSDDKDSDIYQHISKLKDSEFDFSKNLLKYITLRKRIDNKKVQFKIEWNDTSIHDLKIRIKDRTSFKSIEEFNSFFKSIMNQIFPKMVGKELFKTGNYSIYIKEYNFSIIISFNIADYIRNNYSILIKTILPGKKDNNILGLIEI